MNSKKRQILFNLAPKAGALPDYEVHTFANGIRLVHKQVTHSRIAHLGFVLDIGSRDEEPGEEGIAHFWEHMAFKGTQKRKAFHILNRLEAVGGELNAYTTKEKIVFYASLLDVHYGMAADLLTDITFRSTFPEREIDREREVILEEMAMYDDTPDEAINDAFEEKIFSNNGLGGNILGRAETVRKFNRNDFSAFVNKHADNSRTVIASVANLSLKQAVRMLQPLMAQVPARAASQQRQATVVAPVFKEEIRKSLTQAHLVLGRPAFSIHQPERLLFFMLTNILGGPGANSRLNMTLRERRGLVYGIDAGFSPYTDSGMFSIYFATDPKKLNLARDLVYKEMQLLMDKPLGSLQLHSSKEQLMGQLAMAEESNSAMMQVLGKSLLDQGRMEPLSEIFAEIEKATAGQLQELARQYFARDTFSEMAYLPA